MEIKVPSQSCVWTNNDTCVHNVNNKMQILAKRYIFEYEFSGEINNKAKVCFPKSSNAA